MTLNIWKNIFFWFQIAGLLLAGIATIGNRLVTKRIEKIGPYYQKIKSASASVEVFIESSEDLDAHFIGSGGYFSFVKGSTDIFLVSSIDSFASQIGNNTIKYQGYFSLNISDPGFDTSLINLQEAVCAHVNFLALPDNSVVKKGSVTCLINALVQLKLDIPPQQTQTGIILIPDISSLFTKFPPLRK